MARQASPGHRLRRGLQHYWPLDGASPRDALWAPNLLPLDLTPANTPTSAVGPSNNIPLATQLTAASSQRFTLTSDPSLNMGLQSVGFCAAIWCYADALPGTVMGLMAKDGGGTDRNWRLILDGSNHFQILIYNGSSQIGGAVSTIARSATTWYRVFLRCGQTRTEVWVNGVRDFIQAETGYSSEWGNTTQPLNIGNDQVAAGRFWNGRLAQAMMWRGVLPDWKIQRDYGNGAGFDYLRAA